MIDFSSLLNKEQYEAVTYLGSPLLVLSGAGTGKTRVITYKIAYLIQKINFESSRIFAVTFTNKAANEMKKRLYDLIKEDAFNLWIGTFHSNALRILRRDGHLVGLNSGFTVIDQDDRLSLIKSVVKGLGIDDKRFPAKMYLGIISNFKNRMSYVLNEEPGEECYRFPEVFKLYQEHLKRSSQIDFDDMLSYVIRIFLENEDILNFYREFFRYVLVDEFQDTNNLQFKFLKLISSGDNICVVGDDDQSIYGWRGAEVKNIVLFDEYFDDVKIVKLEQNYRSAPEILYLANSVISNNSFRKPKKLRPVCNFNGNVVLKKCFDEREEAEFVANKIDEIYKAGVNLSDIAVLYRTNAQSRTFEVELNRKKIPYQVIGGISFYQRKEVKDILSYLRFYNNFYDKLSFVRSVKSPPRGVGDKTIEKILEISASEGISIFDAIKIFTLNSRGKVVRSLQEYLEIIDELSRFEKISEMIKYIVEVTDYENYIKQFDEIYIADRRINNINELVNSAVSYEESSDEIDLGEFLSFTSLQTSVDEMDSESVKLMTIHSAKGLEFEAVFLVGLENGLFPLYSNMDDDMLMEEERRLCYVGLTRAKRHLYLTYAASRIVYGKRQDMEPSIFIEEMKIDADKNGFKDGKKVDHSKFGKGIILSVKGEGENAKADVIFEKFGIKKMSLKFLKII